MKKGFQTLNLSKVLRQGIQSYLEILLPTSLQIISMEQLLHPNIFLVNLCSKDAKSVFRGDNKRKDSHPPVIPLDKSLVHSNMPNFDTWKWGVQILDLNLYFRILGKITCKESNLRASLKDRGEANTANTNPMYPPVANWTPLQNCFS